MIVTICLVLLALAAMPFWGPIVLVSLVLMGKALLIIVIWPFDLFDQWRRETERREPE